jgi:glycosyltransferase involved in cell wall biosynthesis
VLRQWQTRSLHTGRRTPASTRILPDPDFWGALSARNLIRQAYADHIDVVHIAPTGPLAILALLFAWRFGLPVIGSFPPPAAHAPHIATSYVRGLIRQSRRLLVTSMASRAAFLRAGVSASKMIVWRPGVDAAVFAPSKRSAELRAQWGVSDERPAVLYAGSLSDDRGARRLGAMELALRRTRPMHQLIVAGDGPSLNELQARCPDAIVLGAVPHSDMPQILASADLFVYPSEAISTNLALLEAQASGLPVVVMERGSACERASESSARTCGSHADFVVGTATLVRTNERRRAMQTAAREYAASQGWSTGLTTIYAEYRAAAEVSRVRRNLQPAFISQSRRS